MTIQSVDIRDRTTGEVVDHCKGPTEAGACPRASKDGVVACANRLVAPSDAGPQHWPLWVPPKSRHCVLPWNLQAMRSLEQAEANRNQWLAGLAKEIEYVKGRAEEGDPRFVHLTPGELERVGRWRWSHSHRAKSLDAWERTYLERTRIYLAFTELRMRSTPPSP
ncbi:MAG TPA: hypothetical protein VFZ32_20535 [Micromonosporaceae bacterium]